jgi:hypothetical protein
MKTTQKERAMLRILIASRRVAPWTQVASLFVSIFLTVRVFQALENMELRLLGVDIFHAYSLNAVFGIFASLGGAVSLVAMAWLHELGHKKAMDLLKIKMYGPILMLPFCGLAIPGRKCSDKESFLTHLAGPLTGIISVPVTFIGAANNRPEIVALGLLIAGVNLLNLAPIYGLDGHGILVSVTAPFSKKAANYLNKTFPGVLLIILLAAAALYDWVVLALAAVLALTTVPVLLLDKVLTKTMSGIVESGDIAEEPISKKEALVNLLIAFLLCTALSGAAALSLSHLI